MKNKGETLKSASKDKKGHNGRHTPTGHRVSREDRKSPTEIGREYTRFF